MSASTSGSYVERDIDRELFERVKKYAGKSFRRHIIALESAPGYGNRSLLKELKAKLSRDRDIGPSVRCLYVGRKSNGPSSLSQIGQGLWESSRSNPSSIGRLFRRVARRGPLWIAIVFVGYFVVSAALLVAKGIDVYTSNNPGAPVLTFKFWRHFFTEFFPANWANAVFWLLASQLVASLTVLLAWIIKRSLSLPAVSGLISDRDVGELATAEGKIHKLDDLVGSSKSLVILINGMELLDEADRLFIEDLLDPPANQRETIRFVHSHNIILVAVHFGSFDRERIVRNSSSIAFDELTIPPFSIEELDAIYKLTCTQTSSGVDMPAISDDSLERLLTDAKGNVHAILASLDREVERQVSGQMRKLCSEDIDGFFGVREFTSCILLRERLGTTNGDPVDLTVNLGHREREHEPLGVATKKDLVDWIVNVVTPFYVQVFGFGLPEQPQRIVNRFAESPIAIAVDQLLGLDESKRHVLMQWLEKSGKEALARAHYFHFCMLYDAASAQGQSDRELSVTRASWHLECLDLLGFGAGSLFAIMPGLQDSHKARHADRAVDCLLSSAQFWLKAGNATECDDLLLDACDWLSQIEAFKRSKLVLGTIVERLWQSYWLTSDETTREQLDEIARQLPEIGSLEAWQSNRMLESHFKAQPEDQPSGRTLTSGSAELQNVRLLAKTLATVRRETGNFLPAWRDSSIAFPQPAVATFDTRAEFQLMFLRGHALFHRRKLSDLVSHVQFWATRLDALRVNAHQVGQAALYHMHRAQLLHFLAEALRTDDDKERADPVVEQLTRIADSMCATDLSGEGALSSAFADQAQFEYERALTIVTLVGWRGIELEASFHLGMLLREHTPQERQDASSEWWKRWDEELFHQSLEIEKDCGWVLYSPFIHQIRTEFFLKQNAESSLYDVYTAVQRMEQSGFPRSLVLEWKRKAAGLLNDHGRTDEDRLRCAELYEVWARTEMLLPEARALWSRAEELERAQAFHFAAQSRRILGEFDKAEDLLREADTSLKAHQEAGPADTHSEGDASDIFVAIQMQYAWIRHSQGSDEYPARIRELWSTVREGHRDIANILRSLLTIEYEGGSLGGVWPRESLGPLVDPDRPDHPLPGEWFAGDEPLVIRNRLDFRTCQLLRMVDHMPSIPGDTDATLPGVITLWLAGNSLSPFRLLAKCRWLGIDQFGETVIIIARLGLEVGLSIELRDVMVELLDALQFYFHEVEAIDRAELESLNLLLAYRPDEEDYRKRYRKALLESEQMVARELVVRSEADEWFEVANYIDSYFKLFVDDERRAKMINLSASLNPGVLGRLQARWQAQREKIPMLRECLEAGKHQDGLEYCQTMLPAPDENPLWVSKDDLTILDLWLKFARNDGSATPSELAERSTQLRTMSRRYVSQIAETIADHEVQRLAVRLTNHLNRPSATISTKSMAGQV